MLTRVTFHFPTDREVRYLERPPKCGAIVRSTRDDKAVVSRVERKDGGYEVWCMRPAEKALRARRVARGMRAISAEVGRAAIESAAMAREQRRRRIEWLRVNGSRADRSP